MRKTLTVVIIEKLKAYENQSDFHHCFSVSAEESCETVLKVISASILRHVVQ